MNLAWFERFRRGQVLGMDWGNGGVKLVLLHRDQESRFHFRKKWYYGRPLINEAHSLHDFKSYLRKEGLAGTAVAVNVEDESLKIRKVDLPLMDRQDLQEAVLWKMREVVEGAIEDHVVRFSPLEEYLAGEVKRLSLVAYAVRRQVVREREELVRELGLNVVLMEPTSVAMAAAFERLGKGERGKVYVLIDIGKVKTVFAVVSGSKLLFSRPLPGLSLSEVEKSFLFDPGKAVREEEKLVLEDFYTRMAVEIQRSLDGFSLLFGEHPVGEIFLCGGGAFLPDLPRHLSNDLGIKTDILNPFEGWGLPADSGPLFVPATGLALYTYGR